ncbi:DUF5320 domain-containing protein [Mariniphaga sediminis]|uniref:DUF5320 domain-containing protein n=1 Tax=Mariniphaga sediminis TaxID=1628158 RepID=UPI00356669F7
MPGLNRTGPMGAGPMTGKQLGRCTGSTHDISESKSRNFRRGFHSGSGRVGRRGFRFRWRNPYWNYPKNLCQNSSDETLLQNEVWVLKDQLMRIEKELKKIRKAKNED